jgi:hypothetical protein
MQFFGSVDEVEITTIEKCFAKAGFKVNSYMVSTDDERNINESDNDDDDDRPLRVVQMSRDLFGCEFKELCQIDEKVKTCSEEMTNWDLSAVDILKGTPDDDDDDDIDNESEANEDSESIISVADFTTFLFKAKQFAKHHGKTSLLGTVMDLDDKFTNNFLLTAIRQCKISDFFST